jgi:hypothetical protein
MEGPLNIAKDGALTFVEKDGMDYAAITVQVQLALQSRAALRNNPFKEAAFEFPCSCLNNKPGTQHAPRT